MLTVSAGRQIKRNSDNCCSALYGELQPDGTFQHKATDERFWVSLDLYKDDNPVYNKEGYELDSGSVR